MNLNEKTSNSQNMMDIHAMCKLFDFDSLLEIFTKLISSSENQKLYGRQMDDLKEVYPEFRVFQKKIKWQDIRGNIIDSHVLGEYGVYNTDPDEMRVGCCGLYERITFSWLFSSKEEIERLLVLNKQKNRDDKSSRSDVVVIVSSCKFEPLPYIESFINYLVNYRMQYQLVDITIEQMQNVLEEFQKKITQNQRILSPNSYKN